MAPVLNAALSLRFFIFLALALLAGCSEGGSAPRIDAGSAADLRAGAIWRACAEVTCEGGPMLVDDGGDLALRESLDARSDEISYVGSAEFTDTGRLFPDGAWLFSAGPVADYGDDGRLVGVDVSIVPSPEQLVVRTFLFEWDGQAWMAVSADAVDVTVTTTVS